MTSDRLAEAVREQVALGRVLPLGGGADSAWITEQAAVAVLRGAAARVPGVRLGAVRVAPEPPAVRAGFETTADRPLPVSAGLLRDALWEAAHDRLGLRVAAVDLTVTGLLEGAPAAPGAVPAAPPVPPPGRPAGPGAARAVAEAVSEVPGVARVTSRMGGTGQDAYVQIAVAAGHPVLEVARAVRDVVAPLGVLVTDVE